MNPKEVLEQKMDWLSMGEIAKLCNKDQSLLREEVIALLNSGVINKIGKKRGTKYAIASVEKPEEIEINIRQKILDILKEKKQTDRKTICQELKLYDAKIRPTILEMVDKKEISTNDKARGQLFWLKENDHLFAEKKKEFIQDGKYKAIKKVDLFAEELEEKMVYQFRDVHELVQAAIEVLPEGKKYNASELTYAINEAFPNEFGTLTVMSYGLGQIRRKKDPILKYEQVEDEFGRRYIYWVERK